MKETDTYLKILIDETLRETIAHGTADYPFAYYLEDIWQFHFHCIDWHWHSEVEFVYISQGNATFLVGCNRYHLTANTGIFINQQVLHRFESSDHTIIPNIVFSPHLLSPKESLIYQKYIQPLLTSSLDCQIFSPDIPWQKAVIELLHDIFALQQSENSRELQTIQLLLKLWQIMYEHMTVTPKEPTNKVAIQTQARLQIMLHYIQENYQHNISLEDLAQTVSLSKSSVLNIFNNYLHISPIDYVIHYKLKHAANLLDTTENSVLSIAQSTGFDNVGYFCRKFKELFQLTPSQYRNTRR